MLYQKQRFTQISSTPYARCKAVLRLHDVCLSVCGVGELSPHRLEILETKYMHEQLFALRSPGELGEIWGRLEVGWGKAACWSTKAAISLKRVKMEGKLLWTAYRNSPTFFRMVPSRPPTASSTPKLGIRSPHLKLQSLLSQERIKLRSTNFKFDRYIPRVHPNKSPLKF